MIDFKRLKQVLKQGQPPPPENPWEELAPLEKLYYEVSGRLQQECHNISQEVKRSPSCDQDQLQFNYGRHYGLLSLHQDLSQKLDQLEIEYDTLPLRQQLSYVEQYLHYVKAVVNCSYELIHYHEALKVAEAQLLELDRKVHQTHASQDVPALERALETILDTQERLHTQLEDFAYRNIDTASVRPYYAAYEQKLAALQDNLEETRVWLK